MTEMNEDVTTEDVTTEDWDGHAPAMLVHKKYPHPKGGRHALTPGTREWFEHKLPNGRIAVAAWLYDSDEDRYSRTIIVQEWNNPGGDVYVQGGVHLGAQCSAITNQFLAKLAELPPVTKTK